MPNKKKDPISLQSLLTNRRYLVFSVLGGLVAVLILFSGIIPQFNELQGLRQDVQKGQEQLSLLKQKNADLENIEARKAYASLDAVNKILPSKKPLLELLTSLNQLANQDRVSFLNLSLSPGEIASQSADFLSNASKVRSQQAAAKKSNKAVPKSAQAYDTLTVELEVSGLFKDMQKFFLDIERTAPLTTISSLSMNVKTNGIVQDSDRVLAKLVLQTYFFTHSVRANLDSPLPAIGEKERNIITEIKNYSFPTAYTQTQIEGGDFQDPFGLLQDMKHSQ